MKYLAILKDSLLEALDSKVLYVMVGLSLVVIILIGSVSYHPASVEVDAPRILEHQRSMYGEGGVSVEWRFDHIEDFQTFKNGTEVPKDQRTEPWLYDYHFVVVWAANVTSTEELTPERKKDMAQRADTSLISATENSIKYSGSCMYLKGVKATEQEPSADQLLKTTRVLVTTHGSKAPHRDDWPHNVTVLFAIPVSSLFQFPLSGYIYFIEDWLVCSWGAGAALLLSIIMTGFFIPNMLRKGTVDFLIVKPINRTTLLVYKYIGGLSYMFINTLVIVLGIWLVLGLRSGTWGRGFLVSIPILTFEFAIFYAVSTFFAVLTRSTIASILMACLAWVLLFIVGTAYKIIDDTRHIRDEVALAESRTGDNEDTGNKEIPEKLLPDTVYVIADAIHFVLPRMKDLDVLITRAIRLDLLGADSPETKIAEKRYESFSIFWAVTVTGVWIAGVLGLSCWIFSIKDY